MSSGFFCFVSPPSRAPFPQVFHPRSRPGAAWHRVSGEVCAPRGGGGESGCESGSEASLHPRPSSNVLPSRGSASSGLCDSDGGDVVYRLSGAWDGLVSVTDEAAHATRTLFDAATAVRQSLTPFCVDTPTGLSTPSVWGGLTDALRRRDFDAAKTAKAAVEAAQRERRSASDAAERDFVPSLFEEDGERGVWVLGPGVDATVGKAAEHAVAQATPPATPA